MTPTVRLAIAFLMIAATWPDPALAQTTPRGPVEQLAWMVGGTWTAESTLPTGKRATIEARFQWAGHGRAIKYSVTRKTGEQVLPTLEGICGWHPGKRQFALWEMDADGNLTESTFRVEGSKLIYDEVIHGADGSALPVRAEAIREGEDRFVFKASVEKDGQWPVVFQASYSRAKR